MAEDRTIRRCTHPWNHPSPGPGRGPTTDLGAALTWLREAQEMSREEIAAGAGLDPAVVEAIEQGHRAPDLWQLGGLLEALDADLVGLGLVRELVHTATLLEIRTLLGHGAAARAVREGVVAMWLLLGLAREES